MLIFETKSPLSDVLSESCKPEKLCGDWPEIGDVGAFPISFFIGEMLGCVYIMQYKGGFYVGFESFSSGFGNV